jgi:hypothetical protein
MAPRAIEVEVAPDDRLDRGGHRPGHRDTSPARRQPNSSLKYNRCDISG